MRIVKWIAIGLAILLACGFIAGAIEDKVREKQIENYQMAQEEREKASEQYEFAQRQRELEEQIAELQERQAQLDEELWSYTHGQHRKEMWEPDERLQ